MKRLRRIVFNGLAALSLLLCLIAVAARVLVPRLPRDTLMGRKIDTLPDQTRVTYNYGLSAHGLSFDRRRELLPPMARVPGNLPRMVLSDIDVYGFHLYCGEADGYVSAVYSGRDVQFIEPADGLFVIVPYWALALLAAVLPLASVPALLRRSSRHHDIHLCHSCGYDLRATPDRCPECGTVPTGKLVGPTAQTSPEFYYPTPKASKPRRFGFLLCLLAIGLVFCVVYIWLRRFDLK